MKVPAIWTDDCQGKKDFDGTLIHISTRYWPRGGGFYVLTPERRWEGNEARPEIHPSAHSTIYLRRADGEDVVLAEEWFEGTTQEEVQRTVEAWAQREYEAMVAKVMP